MLTIQRGVFIELELDLIAGRNHARDYGHVVPVATLLVPRTLASDFALGAHVVACGRAPALFDGFASDHRDDCG